MKTNKKRQHYIWKKYLKPWTINNKVWCKRHSAIFNTSLENIAQERYFYETSPLNEFEKRLIISIILSSPPENHNLLMQNFMVYNNISDNSDEYIRKNGIEDIHSRLEHNFSPALQSLYKKDLSFLNDNDSKVSFMYNISQQYNRTKRMHERPVAVLNNLPVSPPKEFEGNLDNSKIVKALSFIFFADTLGNWLYQKAKIYFIETDFEFIASDQPIVNIHANSDFEPVKEMECYYPITPHLALFFTEKNFNNMKINKNETLKYNKLLYSKSYEQIYAFSKETLDLFV
jgi:hypothetical protein